MLSGPFVSVPDAADVFTATSASGLRIDSLSPMRVKEIRLAPGQDGELKVVSLRETGRCRAYVTNTSGRFVSHLFAKGSVMVYFDAGDGHGGNWYPITDREAEGKIFRPEDFASIGPVGVGIPANDQAAFDALIEAWETYVAEEVQSLESNGTILFTAPEYLTTKELRIGTRWGYGSSCLRGAGPNGHTNGFSSSRIRYVGPDPVSEYNVPLSFSSATNSIQRLDGNSWSSRGWSVGMRVDVFSHATSANNFTHLNIASFSADGFTTFLREPLDASTPSGENTANLKPYDEVTVADVAEHKSVLAIQGPHNLRIKDLVIVKFDLNSQLGKLCYGLSLTIEPDVRWANTGSTITLEDVSVYGTRSFPGAACLRIGRRGNPSPVESQCDTITCRRGALRSAGDYGTREQRTIKAAAGTLLILDENEPPHTLRRGQAVRVFTQTDASGNLPAPLHDSPGHYIVSEVVMSTRSGWSTTAAISMQPLCPTSCSLALQGKVS